MQLDLTENLKLLQELIPDLSISQTVLEYKDFLKTSENCGLKTVLEKTCWICQENRYPNLNYHYPHF